MSRISLAFLAVLIVAVSGAALFKTNALQHLEKFLAEEPAPKANPYAQEAREEVQKLLKTYGFSPTDRKADGTYVRPKGHGKGA